MAYLPALQGVMSRERDRRGRFTLICNEPERDLEYFSVSEVTRYIKEILEGDEALAFICVRGEISNFTRHTSGHLYFSLKDEFSKLECVMFRSRGASLKFLPQDGLCVFAWGSVGVYEKGGRYQLYVERLEPAGIGSLYVAFLQLKEKLAKEGLFDPARKRPIPALAWRIGVVTSPSGAALRDIVNIISRRWPGATIVLSPAIVQGEEAPRSLVDAIRLISEYGEIDLLIVGRGGGSVEELWAFNDERVARAIAGSPVPVISAVGHQTDYTIADFVADLRAPTPSAAAELAVADRAEIEARVFSYYSRLYGSMKKLLTSKREMVERLASRRAFSDPLRMIRDRRQELDMRSHELIRLVAHDLKLRRERLLALAGKLDSLSPLATLSRGYSIARLLPDGRLVRSVRGVLPGNLLEVLVADGALECEVKSTREGSVLGSKSPDLRGSSGKA